MAEDILLQPTPRPQEETSKDRPGVDSEVARVWQLKSLSDLVDSKVECLESKLNDGVDRMTSRMNFLSMLYFVVFIVIGMVLGHLATVVYHR